MNGFGFLGHDGEWRDSEAGDFDRLLHRWTLAMGGSSALAGCAARLGQGERHGHTALMLSASEAAAIRSDRLVGDGAQPSAFVLDADSRFYFWRGHADETAIGNALAARCALAATAIDAELDAAIEALFTAADADRTEAQRRAVRVALTQRLLVLTGGPGTGKTTTVLRVLLALMRQAGDTDLTIRLAAPTGKAAQRLQQAIGRGHVELAASLDASWQPWLQQLPQADAQTLHRLLEFDPRSGRWRRDAAQPLAADVVVVDEASMLDLAQMRALLAALPPQARLILVGDADQLASVAAGAVLTDIVQALTQAAAPQLVRLDTVFRATPALSACNAAIRRGDADALSAAATDTTLTTLPVHHGTALRRALQDWGDALGEHLDALRVRERHDDARAADTLRGLQRMQLLCALRESGFGCVTVNEILQSRLRARFVWDDRSWFPGRMVMITRNDEAHGLFNGDIGVALANADGVLVVWFEGRGDEPARAFLPALLPAHEPAFAITIHKSQGSEYDHVAVLLTATPESRILSRQLLYTAASRARQTLSLWATDAVVAAALARPVDRSGGLQAKLNRLLSEAGKAS